MGMTSQELALLGRSRERSRTAMAVRERHISSVGYAITVCYRTVVSTKWRERRDVR